MDSVQLVGDITNSLVKGLMFLSLHVSNFGVNNVLADIHKQSVLCLSTMKAVSKSCSGISRMNIREDERMCV